MEEIHYSNFLLLCFADVSQLHFPVIGMLAENVHSDWGAYFLENLCQQPIKSVGYLAVLMTKQK